MARTVAWRGLKVPCSRLRPKKTTEVSFFDCLEDELLVEILQRIPSLSLIHRCKCVSKHWSTIISSDYFIRCYIKFSKFKSLISSDGEGKNWSDSNLRFALFYQRNHYRGETGLTREQGQFRLGFTLSSMILRSSPPPPGMSLDFLPAHPCPTEPYHVLATDGGLVLCCETLFLQRQYYVCNPLTKQHLKIPPPPINRKWVRVGFLCKTTTGSSSCSFRIVRVPNFEEEYTSLLRAEIYASETGDWTELVLDRSGNLGLLWKYLHCGFLSSAIACGGLLHWKGDGYVFVYDPYNNKDEYTTLELPERRKDDISRDSKLGECKGKLRHSVFYSNSFDVWELKDCFEWFLVQRVRFDQFTSSSPQITSFLKSIGTVYKFVFCLCFHPFDGDVLFTWLKGQIVICCMKTKTMTCVFRLPPTELTGCAPLAFPFVLPWWPVPLTPPPPPPVQALP